MPKYRVYFEQINQTYYDIEADNKAQAIIKAINRYKEDNPPQILGEIEERN